MDSVSLFMQFSPYMYASGHVRRIKQFIYKKNSKKAMTKILGLGKCAKKGRS